MVRRFQVTLVALLLALFGALVCMSGRAQADPYTAECFGCSGTYSGQETFTIDNYNSATVVASHTVWNWSWTQSIINTGETPQGEGMAEVGPLSLTGTVTFTNEDPTDSDIPPSCSATLSADNSDVASSLAVSWTYGVDTTDPTPTPGNGYNFTFAAPGGVESSSCGTPIELYYPNAFTGSGCHYPPAMIGGSTNDGQVAVFFPPGGTQSLSDSCTYTNNSVGSGGGLIQNGTLNDNLTFSSAASGTSTGAPVQSPPTSPTVTPGPKFKDAKADAKSDLIKTIRTYGPACVGLGGGLLTAGTGVLFSSAPGAGATLAVAGGLTAGALTPICGPAIVRGIQDYKTYEDPPLNSFHTFAHAASKTKPANGPKLPACQSKAHAFCTKLRAAYTRYDAAVTAADADAGAIEKTVSREHAAADAGDASAVTSQDADLGKLIRAFAAAQKTQAAAGRQVAAVFKGAHLTFRLSKKQDAKVDAAVLKRLAAQGVSSKKLAAAGVTLKARATNLLTALSTP